jgi:hypothetical protein
MEIALPLDDRPTQGIMFLRDCYTRYERILDIAPNILKTVRFIKPSYSNKRKESITIAPGFDNSDDIENDTRDTYKPESERRYSIDREPSIVVSEIDKLTNGAKTNKEDAEEDIPLSQRSSVALRFIIPK